MNELFAALAAPPFSFIVLVLIGGFSGWLAGRISQTPHWIATLVLIGIAGSWLGSQLCDILGITEPRSVGHYVAAIVGAAAIIGGWQRFHPD